MGMFGPTPEERTAAEKLDKLADAVGAQTLRLAEVEAKLDVSREALRLSDDIVALKQKVVELEIQEAKIKEVHEREKRDVEHMVGLEKKRQQFEIEQAKRETTVTVREENLAAEQKRFTEQMEFHKEQIAGEITRFEKILAGLFDRLPTIEFGGDVADIRSKRAVGDD